VQNAGRVPAMPSRAARVKMLLAAATLISAQGHPGCGSPTEPAQPSPSPRPTQTPSPTFPEGTPNATAFQNLEHVRTLERASGRLTTVLVALVGDATQEGVVASGDSWSHYFADPDAAPPVKLYGWNVRSDGRVIFSESADIQRFDLTELGPFLAVDA